MISHLLAEHRPQQFHFTGFRSVDHMMWPALINPPILNILATALGLQSAMYYYLLFTILATL